MYCIISYLEYFLSLLLLLIYIYIYISSSSVSFWFSSSLMWRLPLSHSLTHSHTHTHTHTHTCSLFLFLQQCSYFLLSCLGVVYFSFLAWIHELWWYIAACAGIQQRYHTYCTYVVHWIVVICVLRQKWLTSDLQYLVQCMIFFEWIGTAKIRLKFI